MDDFDAWMRLMPNDGVFRPKEALGLDRMKLTQLLNRGMIEVQEIDGREFYRATQKQR